MPIDISWYVPQRVISMRSYGDITIDDTIAANHQLITLFDSGIPLIHTLVDQTELKHFPISLNDLLDSLSVLAHPELGWTVVYGKPNKLADFIGGMIARMARVRYRKFNSKMAAINFLVDQDSSLRSALAVGQSTSYPLRRSGWQETSR